MAGTLVLSIATQGLEELEGSSHEIERERRLQNSDLGGNAACRPAWSCFFRDLSRMWSLAFI